MRTQGKWYKLDNAASIVPSAAHGADTRVMRLTCELTEEVDPSALQSALDLAIAGFPHLLCVLRKGLFWYYLDSRDIRPKAVLESLPALSPLYFEGRKNLLFRVVYYKRRINLEIFHVLTDGLGAFAFFKTLIRGYLSIKYGLKFQGIPEETASVAEKSADAFRHYYQKQKGLGQLKTMTAEKAYRLKGERDENLLPHIVEGTVPAGRVIAEAKAHGVSVGVFTVSVYIAAVIDEMAVKDKIHPVVVSVPVDLRRYFPSETARNFFGVINIAFLPADYDGSLESIFKKVKESFREQLEPEQVSRVMNSYENLEHNIAIKMVPLIFKDMVTGRLNDQAASGVTSTVSNLGVIRMPEETEPYIEKFCTFMTAPSEQICVVSFRDKMVFGEVSPYKTHEVMLHFFRRLTKMNIPVELATNDYEEV